MSTTHTSGQERTEQQKQLLRELPGFHLDKGEPCTCGKEAIQTRSRRGFSDSLIFSHRCTECGNEFTTWIEG